MKSAFAAEILDSSAEDNDLLAGDEHDRLSGYIGFDDGGREQEVLKVTLVDSGR
ncbi:MAG: hypothetical protein HY748_16900 [Elusimicrobia bacterium]|nr:hypothetical protein [Elusimicrobiota bacterium]